MPLNLTLNTLSTRLRVISLSMRLCVIIALFHAFVCRRALTVCALDIGNIILLLHIVIVCLTYLQRVCACYISHTTLAMEHHSDEILASSPEVTSPPQLRQRLHEDAHMPAHNLNRILDAAASSDDQGMSSPAPPHDSQAPQTQLDTPVPTPPRADQQLSGNGVANGNRITRWCAVSYTHLTLPTILRV